MMTYLSKIDNQLKDKIDELVKGRNLDRALLDDDIEQQYLSIPNKNGNINAYLTNFLNGLDLNRYMKKKKIISTIQLDLALEKLGFTGSSEDLMLIHLIEDHSINEFPVTVNQMINLNHGIVEYMVKRGQKDYSTFIELLLRSKTLRRCSIPVNELRVQAQRIDEEWNKIIEELDPSENEEEKIEKEIEEVYKDGTIN